MVIGANYRGTLRDDVTRFIHRPRQNRVGDFYIISRGETKMHADCAKKKSRRVFCYVVCVAVYYYKRFSIAFIFSLSLSRKLIRQNTLTTSEKREALSCNNGSGVNYFKFDLAILLTQFYNLKMHDILFKDACGTLQNIIKKLKNFLHYSTIIFEYLCKI